MFGTMLKYLAGFEEYHNLCALDGLTNDVYPQGVHGGAADKADNLPICLLYFVFMSSFGKNNKM